MNRKEHITQPNFSKADFDSLSANEKIDLFVQGYRVPQMQPKAATLEMIRQKMDQKNDSKPIRNLRVYWSAAASIVLIALLTTIYFYQSTDQNHIVAASKGQHLEFTLPDGSEMKVNADSKVTYSASTFTEKRVLELNGEVFFSVQKGKPFVVKTHMGTVEVLGTTLNVFARGEKFNVSCLTGKVKVTVADQSVTILPGEKVEWVGGVLKKTNIGNGENEVAWVRGEFSFDNIPLISIFDEIERQFDVRITAKGINNRFFTGTFKNTNLSEALETICSVMDLDYEIKKGDKVSVKPKTN